MANYAILCQLLLVSEITDIWQDMLHILSYLIGANEYQGINSLLLAPIIF